MEVKNTIHFAATHSVKDVLKYRNTALCGLSAEAVSASRSRFGTNKITKQKQKSLLQRLIRPEEIANMVVYLASPLASATTGGALRVDGGYTDAILP